MKPHIVACSSPEGWAAMAAAEIEFAVRDVIARKGVCNLMLTGGKTAERLYSYWATSSTLPVESIHFLFGDERCVPHNHADSNYALAMRTLFAKGDLSRYEIIRMEAENADKDFAARKYEELLPEVVDILLLGMGTDGHIASLFPYSEALRSTTRSVLPVAGAKLQHERLTITPPVIANAGTTFLLAMGEEKGKVLSEALKTPGDFMSLPVTLALGGTWLLDNAAAFQLYTRQIKWQ